MDALNSWLLTQDWSTPVSLSDLPSLSPSQLAVAALRPDLDVLIRQRAYHEFLQQRREYHGTECTLSKPLFDLPLSLPLPPPASLPSLSPSALLLLPFNPACTPALARSAAERFFSLVRERRGKTPEGSRQQGKAACWTLGVNPTASRGEKGHLAGASSGSDSMDTSLLLLLAGGTTLRLELGMMERADPAFKALRKAVSGWSKKWESEVEVKRTVPLDADKRSHRSFEPPPSSAGPPSQSAFSPSPRPTTPPSSPPTPHCPNSYYMSPPQRPHEGGSLDAGWDLVSDEPQTVEWQPGFYTRQYALIESIDPYTTSLSSAPSFTDEELFLRSFKPRLAALPVPPTTARGGAALRDARHKPEERLAMERIYRSVGGGHLTLDRTRHLLLSPSPSLSPLQQYAKLVAKIVLARDAAKSGYHRILHDSLYPRLEYHGNADPVPELIRLVEALEEDRDY
ncbi:hypothetical protein JCM6882_002623 [Rhodosporidiobolus microsporus]